MEKMTEEQQSIRDLAMEKQKLNKSEQNKKKEEGGEEIEMMELPKLNQNIITRERRDSIDSSCPPTYTSGCHNQLEKKNKKKIKYCAAVFQGLWIIIAVIAIGGTWYSNFRTKSCKVMMSA